MSATSKRLAQIGGTPLATDRSVSCSAATVHALLMGLNIGPALIPAASSHSRRALAGHATSPRAIAMVAPSPSRSVLLRWIVAGRPLLVSAMSATSRATSSDRRNAPANPNSKSARSRRPREAEAAEADPGPHRAAFAHCCYGLGVPGALIHHFGERIESRPERGGADRGLLGHLTDADGSSQGRMRWRWYSLRSCGSCDLKQLSQLFAT